MRLRHHLSSQSRAAATVVALLAACLAAGCTPKPRDVCAHLADIGYTDDADKCSAHALRLEVQQPDKYAKIAKCWMAAKTKEEATAC